MHSDPYNTFSEKLNSTDSYLPFGEMRNLVMNHNGRRRSAFAAFFRYAAGFGLLAALIIGGIFFVNNRNVAPISRIANMASKTDMQSPMSISNGKPEAFATQNAAVRNTIAKNALSSNIPATDEVLNSTQIKTESSVTTLQNSITEKSTDQKTTEVSQTITTVNAAPTAPAALIRASDPNQTSNELWSGFISGGPVFSNNNFSIASMLGAVGLQYRLFGSSSLVVELRHSGFAQTRAGQNGSPYDTTVTAGGQIDKITIGTPSTMETSSTILVNSLDLGYRYVLNPNNSLSPSGEILAGASTSGFVSLESVGIDYRFATSLTFDMSARAEQLFSPSASPLASLGLEATLCFQW